MREMATPKGKGKSTGNMNELGAATGPPGQTARPHQVRWFASFQLYLLMSLFDLHNMRLCSCRMLPIN